MLLADNPISPSPMSAVTLTLQTVGGREETYQPSHFLARHKDSFSASVWFSPNNSNTFFHHQFSDTNCISYSSVLTLSKHSSHRLRAQSWKTAPLQMPATNGVPGYPYFWLGDYKSGVPIPRLRFDSLLAWFTGLGKCFTYDYQCIVKDTTQE